MTKHRNGRYTKRSSTIDPYKNLAADVIIDAIIIASGKSPASKKDCIEAKCWLRSETCKRWADVIGIDIEAALEHRNSLVRLDNAD